MAEGFAKKIHLDKFEIYSAGIEKHGLNPIAIKVMNEENIDISKHTSNTVDELPIKDFDYVITVCGHADEYCPHFPAKTKIIHMGFDDPPKLAKKINSEEEVLNIYRRVRDEIQEAIKNLNNKLL